MVIPVASDGGQIWGFERERSQQMGWCGPVGECLLSCFTGMPKVMTPLVTSPLESRCATSAASSADSGAMSTQTRSALSLARTSQQSHRNVSLRGWLQGHEWSGVCVCVCMHVCVCVCVLMTVVTLMTGAMDLKTGCRWFSVVSSKCFAGKFKV